jgi:polar amino acid transport system substrate-binding protein
MTRRLVTTLSVLALGTALAACAPADEGTEPAASPTPTTGPAESPEPTAAACTPDTLETQTPGVLTLATDEPVFEPWMTDNDPANGEGYEGAVAAALAAELGYGPDQVEWVRVPFNAVIQPGPKDFDAAINQFSITAKRAQAVDFSSGYYDVAQSVVAVKGTPGAEATSIADLQELTLGAQVGTTSLDAIETVIAPSTDAQIYNTNNDAVEALKNGQIDALVVDLPTAFFVTAVQIPKGTVVGQLPPTGGEPEQFGFVLDLGSPLTECVSQAVDTLRADGTLAALDEEWLADVAGAPVLQ